MPTDRWQDLSRRLQSVAYRQCMGYGASQISVTLYLDRGELKYWAEPQVTHYEPHGQGRQILRHLGATLHVDDQDSDDSDVEQLEEDQ